MDCKTTAMLKCLSSTLDPTQTLQPLRNAMQRAGLSPTALDCRLPPGTATQFASRWAPPWRPCRVTAKATDGALVSAAAFPVDFSADGKRWNPPYDGSTVQVAAIPAF